MGLLPFAFAGTAFILIGAHEALQATFSNRKQDSQSRSQSSLFSISVSIFSAFFIINSLVSLFDAHNSNDAVGSVLQLQLIPIALLFLSYSLLSLFTFPLPLPSSLLELLAAFAFVEEFLLFYLQRKDPTGVENRYYSLLLVPIAVCVFSTFLELKSPGSAFPKLGRGMGLILQGTWIIQIGLALFSGWVAQGCSLHQLSRGNYTLRCKGHMDYHRASALATLQFNCQLALMVVLSVGAYSVISARNGGSLESSSAAASYRPIGFAEMQQLENSTNFSLDSDDDDGDGNGDVEERQKETVVEHGNMNGHGRSH
ncbi:hypothetical protein HN51_041709 [Arachis hypogaea]|uniref:transmembrane protein 45B n=1 Tax=Arachis ipaensis TaxID=130454 RepID=UPI0007AF5793|nr:transmembrane protein 45B [Arachis ipaensis]XP_025659081.1 transmembrane protein 45B [Arachis hypogaea]QHN87527.1 Transmembrane proteinB [Arachis hypogaea]